MPPRTDVAWLMVAEGGEDTGETAGLGGNAFPGRKLGYRECLAETPGVPSSSTTDPCWCRGTVILAGCMGEE